MCGIAGIWNISDEGAAAAAIAAMKTAMRHRGPDGDGTFIQSPVSLGHVRLAIIDLSEGGRQPMSTADGHFTITYNGELYNYRSLKAELKDYPFCTGSDTEVLLHAQRSAEGFYSRLGFTPRGEPFDEVDIAHIEMFREP